MALLRSPRTDYPFQLSFVLSRYRQCRAACPHAAQHSRSKAIGKLCMRHNTSGPEVVMIEEAPDATHLTWQYQDHSWPEAPRMTILNDPHLEQLLDRLRELSDAQTPAIRAHRAE